jgi:hypothetical protein
MIIGYARVSTDGQSVEAQEAALKTAGAGALRFLESIEFEVGTVEKLVLHLATNRGNDVKQYAVGEANEWTLLAIFVCVRPLLKIERGSIARVERRAVEAGKINHLGEAIGDVLVVLDEQDAQAFCCPRPLRGNGHVRGRPYERNHLSEHRSVARARTARGQSAALQFGELIADRKTQPKAATGATDALLLLEERLEQPGRGGFVEADPRVLYLKIDTSRLRSDPDRDASRRGVNLIALDRRLSITCRRRMGSSLTKQDASGPSNSRLRPA